MNQVLFLLTLTHLFASSLQTSSHFNGLPDLDEYFDGLGRTSENSVHDTRGTRAVGTENFGNGILGSSAGAGADALRSIAVQSDGKLVGVGRNESNTALARYNPDGSIDTSFNTSGKVITNIGGNSSLAHGVAINTLGLIYVTGRYTPAGTSDFLLLRYRTDGVLDTAFNTIGYNIIDYSSRGDIARAISIQTDGKPVISGYSNDTSLFHFAVVRTLDSGELDTSFNTNGKVRKPIAALGDGALGSCLQTDGGIVAVGNSFNGANWDVMAARYLVDGTLDTAFYTTGKRTFVVGTSDDVAFAVTVDTLARLVLAGKSYNGNDMDISVSRLMSDGSLDTTFKTNGKPTYSLGTGADVGAGIYIPTNGVIVVAGDTRNDSNQDFGIIQLLTDGTLDTSFHTSGKYSTPVGTLDDFGIAVVSIQDRVYTVAGRYDNGSDIDFAIVRYGLDGTLANSGGLDYSFATAGKTAQIFAGSAATGFAMQTDGKSLIGLGSTLKRFTVAGILDTSFLTTGQVISTAFQAQGIELDTSGRILCATGRYLSDGILDTSFRTGGIGQSFTGQRVILSTDGRMMTSSTNSIRRTTTDGRLDTTFKTTGTLVSTLTTFSSNAIQAETTLYRTYFAGRAQDVGLGLRVGRLLSNGNLDTSFFTEGNRTLELGTDVPEINSIMVDSGAGLWLVGALRVDSPNRSLAILKFLSDGSLDTAFKTIGRYVEFYDNDDTFTGAVPGYSNKFLGAGGSRVSALYKFNSNGVIDTTFAYTATGIGGLNWIRNDTKGFIYSTDSSGRIVRFYP